MNAEQRGFFAILGDDDSRGGSYLLHIEMKTPALSVAEGAVSLPFGRFHQGQPIDIPAGMLLYIGSAMGQQGSSSLARRLLRHATRTGKRPYHPIRDQMLTVFPSIGLADAPLKPPTGKKRHWHIDYLLDEETAVLQHITILRSRTRLETPLTHLLMADPATYIIQPGLGASDAAGETHLLGVTAVSDWWQTLLERVRQLIR